MPKKNQVPESADGSTTSQVPQVNINVFRDMTIGEHVNVQIGNVDVQPHIHLSPELPPLLKTLQQAVYLRQQANNLEQSLHFYIVPEVTPLLGGKQRFDLSSEVEQFLKDPQQRLLLMLGDSGAGKSLFTQQLEKNKWESYKSGQRIPLRIELKKFSDAEVKQCLQKTFAELGFPESALPNLRQQYQFLFILDGYDEIGGQTSFNLYQANHLELWNAKVIITCRTQALSGDHVALFAPQQNNPNAWRELYLAPFAKQAVQEYLTRYAAEHPEATQLAGYVEKTFELSSLLSNPFILSLFVQAFPQLAPRLTADRFTALTSHEIYSAFMQQWFVREEVFLAQKIGLSPSRDVKREFRVFAQRLALNMFQAKAVKITYSPPGDANEAATHPWHAFFSHDDAHTVQCRRACPLRRIGKHQYSFVHKSFLEYFVAEALWTAIAHLPHTADQLTTRLWPEESAIVHFLAERLNAMPDKAAHIERLFEVVKSSRNKAANSRKAANAITLLNMARVSFSGMDLHGIKIEGANLENAILHQTNLSCADLRQVNLRNTYLAEANLSGSQMDNVRFDEWPYLQHEGNVYCSYSPDGRYLVTGSTSKIRLWERVTGKCVRVFEGHSEPVKNISFSGDGRLLAAGSFDVRVPIWDVESGSLLKMLSVDTGRVWSVSFSHDGELLASGNSDNTIRLWKVASGDLLRIIREAHIGWVNSVNISGDEKLLASSGGDGTIKLWQVVNGMLSQTFEGHTDIILSVSFSRNSKWLASASLDKTVRIWNVENGQSLHVLTGHTDIVMSASFNNDGSQLASGSQDRTARIWDIKSGRLLQTFEGHTESVNSVSFCNDGKQLASGSSDGTVRVWDINITNDELQAYEKSEKVLAINFSSDEILLVSATQCGLVLQVRSLANGNLFRSKYINVNSSKEDKESVHQTVSNRMLNNLLWDVMSSHSIKKQGINMVISTYFNDSTVKLALANQNKKIDLWEMMDNQAQIVKTLEGHTSYISSMSFSRNGKSLATGSSDTTARVWDTASGWLLKTLEGHTGSIYSLDWNNNGKLLATASVDRTIKLWDVESNKLLHTLKGHLDNVMNINFSPDGSKLASGGSDRIINVWDTASGILLQSFKGHRDEIGSVSVSFSLDGLLLASGSLDKTIRVWDIKKGHCLQTLPLDEGANNVAFTPTGYIVSSQSYSIKTWQPINSYQGLYWQLVWSTTLQQQLFVQGCKVEEVTDLSSNNRRLLQQRGAVCPTSVPKSSASLLNQHSQVLFKPPASSINPKAVSSSETQTSSSAMPVTPTTATFSRYSVFSASPQVAPSISRGKQNAPNKAEDENRKNVSICVIQ
jgi:WD40 repeat protein